MTDNFDYDTVPPTFLHCVKKECPKTNDCLRYKVMLCANSKQSSMSIVNPARIPGNGEECSYYYPDQLSRFALGITHLLDNLPHSKALKVDQALKDYFRRNIYYRIRNQERLISPKEQKFIRELFQYLEITEEPQFDEYVEQYDW